MQSTTRELKLFKKSEGSRSVGNFFVVLIYQNGKRKKNIVFINIMFGMLRSFSAFLA